MVVFAHSGIGQICGSSAQVVVSISGSQRHASPSNRRSLMNGCGNATFRNMSMLKNMFKLD